LKIKFFYEKKLRKTFGEICFFQFIWVEIAFLVKTFIYAKNLGGGNPM
jgi:hypothetical protein